MNFDVLVSQTRNNLLQCTAKIKNIALLLHLVVFEGRLIIIQAANIAVLVTRRR